MNRERFLVIILLIIYSIGSLSLLLKSPPIWPDEAIYFSVIRKILNPTLPVETLRIINGWHEMLFISQSLFFIILSIWFKFVALTLFNLRLFSMFMGAGFILVFYLLSNLFSFNKSYILYLTLWALIIDNTFLKASRVSRPEIFLIFSGYLSIYFFFRWHNSVTQKNIIPLFLILSGIFASLSVLIHPYGIIFFLSIVFYLLLNNKLKPLASKRLYLYIASFIFPILIWLFAIRPDISILKNVLQLSSLRRNLDQSAITWFLDYYLYYPDIDQKIINIAYISLTFIYLKYTRGGKNDLSIFFGITLILSWIFSIMGKTHWYLFLPIPFVLISNAILMNQTNKKSLIYKLTLTILILLIVMNIRSYINNIQNLGGENYSYESYTTKILEIIPDHKKVYLSAKPDPYFGFVENQRNNQLFEFPSLPTSTAIYRGVLNEVDYVIYTGTYNKFIFENLLEDYINKNAFKSYLIGGEEKQYRALVIELKPRNERVN